jgi:hypothetical protein
LLSVTACGSGHSFTTPVRIFDGLVLADIVANGKTRGQALIDTGSPVTVLVGTAFTRYSPPMGLGTLDELQFGGLTFDQVVVDGMLSASTSTSVSGIVGCTVLCRLSLSIDYRGSKITIGPEPMLFGVERPDTTIPFQLKGGGTAPVGDGTFVTVPASRIFIEGIVEGRSVTFLLDTGSDTVALRSDIFQGLTGDGRRTLTSTGATELGVSNVQLARLRSVAVGEIEVARAVASSGTNIDQLLSDLSMEAGRSIDGSLGAPFLNATNLTVDYPGRAISLARYSGGDGQPDLFERVGIGLGATTDGAHVAVSMVLAGTDAERQGVKVGDIVSGIDGRILSGSLRSELLDATLALTGMPGQTHAIDFGCAGCPGFQGTRTIAIDDLLPL